MQQRSPSPRRREPVLSRPASLPYLALIASALLAAGCEEERHVAGPTRPRSRAADVVGVDLGDQERVASKPNAGAAAQPRAKAPKNSGPIIGQRTTDIKDANTELKTGKAQVASTRIVARDPITIQGNAYVSIIGQASILNIKHAVDLFQAENGRYPKDYNEFMEEIIKKNNIALPRLPPYQDYSYDEKEHKLVLLEYPDRKNPPAQ